MMATNFPVRFLDSTKLIEHIRGNIELLRSIVIEPLSYVGGGDDTKRNVAAWQTLSDDVIPYLDALSKISNIADDASALDKLMRSSPEEIFTLTRDLEDILLPLLFNADILINDEEEYGSAFKTSCDLLVCTLRLCEHEQETSGLVRILKSALRFCPKTDRVDEVLIASTCTSVVQWSSVDNAVEFLCHVFRFLCDVDYVERRIHLLDKKTMNTIRKNLLGYLEVCSPRTCVRIAVELLPKVISISDGMSTHDNERSTMSEMVSEIWTVVLRSFQFPDNSNDDIVREWSPNGFLLLGCTADLFFTVGIRHDDDEYVDWTSGVAFWKIVQYGLTSADSLRRKQSLYLLRRAIDCVQQQSNVVDARCQRPLLCDLFTWTSAASERIRKCFEDVMFVLETLEEKHVHVIKPMFPTVKCLIDATEIKGDDNARLSSWSLHTSWIIVVLRRMLVHESKTIKLWLIEEICSLDLVKVPIFDQGTHKFLQYHFLMSLNDTTIFTGIGKTSEFCFTNLLALHLKRCMESLKTDEARGSYFRQFLRNIHSSVWSAVPFFYVAKTLSTLPMRPHWNLDSINDMRELVVNTVRTHDTFIRVATEEYLLSAFLHFADKTVLTLSELGYILSIFQDLRRGTPLWDKVVAWTKEAEFAEPRLADKFLEEATTSILTCVHQHSDGYSDFTTVKQSSEIRRVARMAVLLTDAMSLSDASSNMKPFVNILYTAYSRLYMPKEKLEATMKYFLAIMSEITSLQNRNFCSQIEYDTRSYITTCSDEFMKCFRKIIFGGSLQLDEYEHLEIHFKFIRLLIENEEFKLKNEKCGLYVTPHMMGLAEACRRSFERLEDETICTYMDNIANVKCFALVSRSLSKSAPTLTKHCVTQLMTTLLTLTDGNRLCSTPKMEEPFIFSQWTHSRNPNQIASDYMQCLWSCVFHLLEIAQLNSHAKPFLVKFNADTLLSKGIEALQIEGVESLAIMFKCFELLLPQILSTRLKFIEQIVDRCWMALIENRPSVSFWDALIAFVDMVFQAKLMSDVNMLECLSKHGRQLYEKSKTYHGMYLPLVKRVVAVWKNSKHPSEFQSVHVQILIQGLLFGHVHRKDHKVVKDTEAYIVSLGETISTNLFMESDYLHDKKVRVYSVVSIITISEERSNIVVRALVQGLIETDAEITGSKQRHYANSMIHRVKQRVWQSLLILEPVYTEELALKVFSTIIEVLIDVNLQPSVRYLIEWLASRICLRFTAFWAHMWAALDTAEKTRVGSLGSFLSIICHVGCANIQLCHAGSDNGPRVEFITKAIALILPWTSVQQFNTRIYAQVTLHKLWQLCKSRDELNEFKKLMEMYRPIENFFRVSIAHRVSARNALKLNNFYFQVFDVEKHYSVEAIFYELPRLCNVLEDEWLEKKLFDDAHYSYSEPSSSLILPLSSEDRSLAKLQTGSWIIRSASDNGDADAVVENESVSAGSGGGDLQRKLTPWKQEIFSNYEDICAASDSSVYGHKRENQRTDDVNDDQLVVVASLIDKATNLGGLCRTCEVFGASRYVIGNQSYVDDKLFQTLSVSSEKWVPIEEIKAHNLKDYLLNMKTDGYTVVGVEQTSNSVKLNTFKFPKKTVLVLGKEKEGIPVEIIQLMDVCVEIPQQGLVRSLNVHVTGAILIWEYRRQRSELKEVAN